MSASKWRERKLSSNDALSTIIDCAHTIVAMQCLKGNCQQRVTEANALLTQRQSSRKRQTYQLFLHDVHRKCGPHIMLVCAVALGQVRIVCMTKRERIVLVHELEAKKDQLPLNSQVLRSLATRHNVPNANSSYAKINNEGQDDLDQATRKGASVNQLGQRRGSETGDEAVYRTTSPTRGQLPTEYERHTIYEGNSKDPSAEEVIEYGSLDGVAKVFDKYVCDTIRTIPIQSDGVTSWKAVTIAFPIWAGMDCLMSLDIYNWGVDYFAMGLFNAEVKWVKGGRHIILKKESITLIVPSVEATLKGVEDEAIIKVFGSDIYCAVNQSRVRKEELKEGKPTTECVSMILTEGGAIVNLSLGLEQGLELQKKLSA